MYSRIIVGYDGSAYGAAALLQAAELARCTAAELHLVAVCDSSGGMAIAQATGAGDALGNEMALLQPALEESGRRLRDTGLTVTCAIRSGEPAAEIAAHAREIRADLIVLGHTGKGVFSRWMLGSVGAALLDHPPCSLLVAMPR